MPDVLPSRESYPQLTSVSMTGFRAVRDSGPVPLRPFNVIIGRNGSGKGAVITALQWLDAALRSTVTAASDQFRGVGGILYAGPRGRTLKMRVGLEWSCGTTYEVGVSPRSATPLRERLELAGAPHITEPEAHDVLALARDHTPGTAPIRAFWESAVFLNLSSAPVPEGAPSSRSSGDPILDEGGMQLAGLVRALSRKSRARLMERVGELIPEALDGRRLGVAPWQVSGGARRVVAILALLEHRPAPSLLCIREVENGLDPWVSCHLVRHLRAASDRGVQVVLTTHSPWLLDGVVPMDDILYAERVDGGTTYQQFSGMDSVRAFSPHVPAGTRYINHRG